MSMVIKGLIVNLGIVIFIPMLVAISVYERHRQTYLQSWVTGSSIFFIVSVVAWIVFGGLMRVTK